MATLFIFTSKYRYPSPIKGEILKPSLQLPGSVVPPPSIVERVWRGADEPVPGRYLVRQHHAAQKDPLHRGVSLLGRGRYPERCWLERSIHEHLHNAMGCGHIVTRDGNTGFSLASLQYPESEQGLTYKKG